MSILAEEASVYHGVASLTDGKKVRPRRTSRVSSGKRAIIGAPIKKSGRGHAFFPPARRYFSKALPAWNAAFGGIGK